MSFTTVPAVADGDALLASQQRIWVKANLEANAPHMVTAKGDVPISSGANSITVLPVSTDGKALVSDSTQASGRKVANSGLVPVGGIVIWSGAVVDIPAGWQLCNGSLGTPDLRDRFIVGSGTTYATGDTGGATTANLQHKHDAQTTDAAPDHTHTQANTDSDGAHAHNYNAPGIYTGLQVATVAGAVPVAYMGHAHTLAGNTSTDGAHAHTNPDTGNGGAGHTHTDGDTTNSLSAAQDILPPYYALCYVMRVLETLISDSFTDADATDLSAHAPDIAPVGSAWALFNVGLGDPITIESNKASSGVGAAYSMYAIDAGESDLIITIDIGLAADLNVAGVIARATDSANYWRFFVNHTNAYISEVTASIVTQRDVAAHGLAPGTHTLTVTLKGQDMTLDFGAASLSYSSAVRQTETLVGLVAENVDPIVPLTLDNLLVTKNP